MTPARPHPSPGRRSTRRASRSTGSDRGALGDPLVRRLLADQLGSATARSRGWAEYDVRPWQTEAERAELEARVRDVVGLSLEPSAHAIVRCVDEKSQIQALEGTQPSRPPPRALPAGDLGVEQRLTGPQEVTPVKRSWTAVRPPVPRVAGQLAAVNDRGLLGAVNVLVRVHMVGAGGVEPPSSSAPANYKEPLCGRPLFAGRVRP